MRKMRNRQTPSLIMSSHQQWYIAVVREIPMASAEQVRDTFREVDFFILFVDSWSQDSVLVGREEHLSGMLQHSLSDSFHLLLVQVRQISEDNPVLALHLHIRAT